MWNELRWSVAVSTLVMVAQPAQAQSRFTSGFYQIEAGLYTECCGFGGAFIYRLPDENQRFVELFVDPARNTARMTFLAADMFTVFGTYPWVSGSGFNFSFSNGIVFPDFIRFGGTMPAPTPGQPAWSYTVSNAAGGLRINGVAVTPPFGADIPNQFKHTNVVATLVRATVALDRIEHDGDSVRFHFIGPPPYDYTVEFADSLTTPNWQPLASYRAKLQDIDVVVTNSVANAQARFFRVRQEPCGCR